MYRVSLPRILGQDGNGVVNFGEFASWAGPRLGLELGLASQTFRDFPVFSGIFYSFTKDLKTQKEGQLFFCYVIF